MSSQLVPSPPINTASEPPDKPASQPVSYRPFHKLPIPPRKPDSHITSQSGNKCRQAGRGHSSQDSKGDTESLLLVPSSRLLPKDAWPCCLTPRWAQWRGGAGGGIAAASVSAHFSRVFRGPADRATLRPERPPSCRPDLPPCLSQSPLPVRPG